MTHPTRRTVMAGAAGAAALKAGGAFAQAASGPVALNIIDVAGNLPVRQCDEIALLHEGRLEAAGSPDEVLTSETIQRIFGVAVAIRPGASGRRHIEYLIEAEGRERS